MWLRVTLAFAALHVARPLRELGPFNIHPSLVSNIHLLVPLKVPDQQEPKLRISNSWEESKEIQHTDHDESFSSIPGYAFTLDTDSILTDKGTVPKPEVQVNLNHQGHSIYAENEWPHTHNEGHGMHRSDKTKDEKQGQKTDDSTEARLRECRTLGRHHSPESRELLVQLCSELVELLASRCKCCDEPPRTRAKKTNSVAMPWFSSFDSRRETPPAYADLGQMTCQRCGLYFCTKKKVKEHVNSCHKQLKPSNNSLGMHNVRPSRILTRRSRDSLRCAQK